MSPVCPEFRREVGTVVDQKGDVPGLGERHKDFRCAPNGIRFRRRLVLALQAELQAGDVARIESSFQRVGKSTGLEAGGRNEIEAACSRAVGVGHEAVLIRTGARRIRGRGSSQEKSKSSVDRRQPDKRCEDDADGQNDDERVGTAFPGLPVGFLGPSAAGFAGVHKFQMVCRHAGSPCPNRTSARGLPVYRPGFRRFPQAEVRGWGAARIFSEKDSS